jgi:RNA polymerase sigma-70 factor, ECF subfamily
MIAAMNWELSVGVRQHMDNAIASRDLAIWDMTITNPPEDPQHCPPAVTWLMNLRDGRVHRLRLFHARRDRERSALPRGQREAAAGR